MIEVIEKKGTQILSTPNKKTSGTKNNTQKP